MSPAVRQEFAAMRPVGLQPLQIIPKIITEFGWRTSGRPRPDHQFVETCVCQFEILETNFMYRTLPEPTGGPRTVSAQAASEADHPPNTADTAGPLQPTHLDQRDPGRPGSGSLDVCNDANCDYDWCVCRIGTPNSNNNLPLAAAEDDISAISNFMSEIHAIIAANPDLRLNPAYRPDPRSEPEDRPDPRSEPEDRPDPRPEPADRPDPCSEPADGPDLIPEPADGPDLIPEPADRPDLISEPADGPDLIPEPADRPDLIPEPADRPDLISEPADGPDLIPEPADRPDLISEPADGPDLIPEPADRPDLIPEPADRPDPRPEPAHRFRAVLILRGGRHSGSACENPVANPDPRANPAENPDNRN